MPLFCTVCRSNLCVRLVKRAKAAYNISYTQLLSNLEVTPRFELLGRLSCGVRSCSRALFFKAFVLLRGMRWRRQIIGVGEKVGGNFAAAKAPLQLAAWGKFFLCVGACGFRREGVKLSEAGEGAKIPARAGARSRAPKAGWFTGVARHFFSALFRLIFAAFALALIAGGKRDPARPCGTVRVPPRLFSLVVGNGGALGLPASFLFPSAGGGDSLSRSRGSCRHDSPPRPVAQGLRANFSTACSKVIFYYKRENRVSEFPCCSGFRSRDRA